MLKPVLAALLLSGLADAASAEDPASLPVPPAAKELAEKAIDSFKAGDRDGACTDAQAAKDAGHPNVEQLIKMVCKNAFVGRGEYKARKSSETFKNDDLKPKPNSITARGPVPPQDAANPNLAAAGGPAGPAGAASPGASGAASGPSGPGAGASYARATASPGGPGLGVAPIAPGAGAAPASANAAFDAYEAARNAEGFLGTGRFGDAAAGAEAALRIDRGSVKAYAVLANARKALGDPAAAKAAAQQGLALQPNNIMLLKLLADSQNKLGESAEAAMTAERLINIQPTDGMGYALKAYSAGISGDRETMLKLLRQAAAFDPSFERSAAEAEAAPPDSKRPFFLPGEVRVEVASGARKRADRKSEAAGRLKAALFIGLMLGPIWLVLWMRARARAAAELAQEAQAGADDAAPKA